MIIDTIKSLLSYSDLTEERKMYLSTKLVSLEDIAKLTNEEAKELHDAVRVGQTKYEQNILTSSNSNAINDYTDAKAAIDELFYEAEMTTLKNMGIATDPDVTAPQRALEDIAKGNASE